MEIEAFEAKNKLETLLDRVADGEEIVIMRQGEPVARLVPYPARIDTPKVRAALERIRARAGNGKEAFDWPALRAERDAGRRF